MVFGLSPVRFWLAPLPEAPVCREEVPVRRWRRSRRIRAAEGPRAQRARLETGVGDEVAAGAVVGADVGRGRGGDRVAKALAAVAADAAPARITGEEGWTW